MFVEKSNIAAATVNRLIVAALAILLSSIGEAASVVIDEAGMNAIFSQTAFGDTPIGVRFNPERQIVAPDLLVIDSLSELQALYSLASDPAPIVTAFFVDQLNVCSTVEPDVSGVWGGCAQLPGRVFVEDSHVAEFMADTLMGHELGHNLNLEHDFLDPTSLMSILPPHGTSLREEQVAIILQSPLVQIDSTGQRFIQITPIAIVDAPETSMMVPLGAALGALLTTKRKKSSTMRS